MKHLQQLKKENPDVQDQKSTRIKEETPKVFEDVEKKSVKEEIDDGLQQKLEFINEEKETVKSGTGGKCKEDNIEAVKIENMVQNFSVKVKCKPVKKLKNKASPSFGEISPFRRKKLKT